MLTRRTPVRIRQVFAVSTIMFRQQDQLVEKTSDTLR